MMETSTNTELKKLTKIAKDIQNIENEISQAVAKQRTMLFDLKQQEEEVRAAIQNAMQENGIKHIENEILSITYIAETSRKTLDSKRLKSAMPEIWDRFSKNSNVKPSIRIKVKNVE